jgi:hypothetical protein
LNDIFISFRETTAIPVTGTPLVMRLWKQVRTSRRDYPLPAEFYISFVDSLYSDARTLFVGSIAAVVIAFIAAWKSGEMRLLAFALAMIAVLVARALPRWNSPPS